jgi:hypothetical protein
MRSVPTNPFGEAMVHFGSDTAARRAAVAMGGVSGAVIGGAIWGLTYKQIGWWGIVLPLIGTAGGAAMWAALNVGAAR